MLGNRKMMNLTGIAIAILLVSASAAFGEAYASAQNGDWAVTSTWAEQNGTTGIHNYIPTVAGTVYIHGRPYRNHQWLGCGDGHYLPPQCRLRVHDSRRQFWRWNPQHYGRLIDRNLSGQQ